MDRRFTIEMSNSPIRHNGGSFPKQKGIRGEKLAVHLLEKLGMQNPRRGASQRYGAVEPDVLTDSLPDHWIEVKFREEARCIYNYIEQAERDTEKNGKQPIVLYKSTNKKWLVIADAKYILPILVDQTKAS